MTMVSEQQVARVITDAHDYDSYSPATEVQCHLLLEIRDLLVQIKNGQVDVKTELQRIKIIVGQYTGVRTK